jgi:adenylate kinase family enzyme
MQTANAISAHALHREALYREALTEFHGAIQTASLVLSEFHHASAASRLALTDCDTALREKLAQTRSLRHTDFDRWFEGAVAEQEQTEIDLRQSLQEYLAEQSEFSEKIMAELSAFRLAKAERRQEVAALIGEFSRLQAARRDALKQTLSAVKESQEKWHLELKAMISEAKEIRLNDVKRMFEKFKIESEARRKALWSRRVKVAAMLEQFRCARLSPTPKPNR